MLYNNNYVNEIVTVKIEKFRSLFLFKIEK